MSRAADLDAGVVIHSNPARMVWVTVAVIGGTLWGMWPTVSGQRAPDAKDAIPVAFAVVIIALAVWLSRKSYIWADAAGIGYATPLWKAFASWSQVAGYTIERLSDVRGNTFTYIVLRDAANEPVLKVKKDWGPQSDNERLLHYIDRHVALHAGTREIGTETGVG